MQINQLFRASKIEPSPLRIIHHWACSGGTLISKCIAANPGIIFLSEVHPDAYLRLVEPALANYLPTDICHQLSAVHNGRDPVLARAAFSGAIRGLANKCDQLGLCLVLRSHDHIDFFVGSLPKQSFTISDCFRNEFKLLEFLTVRHPLDCWLGLVESNWAPQISFASVDSFCSRCQMMLNASHGFSSLKYELFVADPVPSLQAICHSLNLRFDVTALNQFNNVVMSGNSGRQGIDIAPRPRRTVSNDLEKELSRSTHYEQICDAMGYESSPNAAFPYLL